MRTCNRVDHLQRLVVFLLELGHKRVLITAALAVSEAILVVHCCEVPLLTAGKSSGQLSNCW